MPLPKSNPELPSILQDRFTDREPSIHVVNRYLQAVTAPLPAIMFYGVGGVGKSWLLRKLRLEVQARNIPSVLVDYTREQGSGAYLNDPLLLLADLRRLSVAPCPRFDLAFTLSLVRRYHLDEAALTNRWKTSGLSAGWEVMKALGGGVHPILGGALAVMEKGFDAVKDHAFVSSLRANFLQDLQGLQTKDLATIECELLWRLTQDLKNEGALPLRALNVARAVVFIDTLESLIPAGLSESEEARVTERLRELIVALRDRVLFIFAGQNRLDWEFLHQDWADPAWLEQHLLGGLAEPDARDFLNHCGVVETDVQDAILQRCLPIEDNALHPASLGLFADIAFLEMQASRTPTPALFAEIDAGDMNKLVLRFLKSLPTQAEQDWIRHLAITPSFDEAAARTRFSAAQSMTQDAAWQTLRSLSFLVPSPTQPGWFSIHSVVQDALRHSQTIEPEWHTRWRTYWESRPSPDTDPLAWFHHWSLDREAATRAWSKLAEDARSSLKMAAHLELLSWWNPTGLTTRPPADTIDGRSLNSLAVELFNATLGDRAINLQLAIDAYHNALRVLTREDFPAHWAATQNNLGNAHLFLPTGDRAANLQLAIGAYQNALRVRTRDHFPADWAMTQNNLGLAYRNLPTGDRAANLQLAIDAYQNALRVRTRDHFPADWAATQNNLGLAYQDLPTGDRAANLQLAIDAYHNALRVRTREDFPADWAATQLNLALAHSASASLDPVDCERQLKEARASIDRALQTFIATGHQHYAEQARQLRDQIYGMSCQRP